MRMRVRTAVAAGTIAVAGITGIAVAGPALRSASASTSADTATPSTTSPDPSSSGPSSALTSRHEQRVKDALAGLVSNGTLTQAQADAVAKALAKSDAPHPHRPGFAGPGDPEGPGGPGDRGDHGDHGARGLFAGPGAGLDAAAKALGISTDELRTALRDGDTLADVAKAHKVEVKALVDALVKAATERLDAAVADGRLTTAQADTIKANLRERISDLVNQDLPGRGMFGPGHRHGMGAGADAVQPSA